MQVEVNGQMHDVCEDCGAVVGHGCPDSESCDCVDSQDMLRRVIARLNAWDTQAGWDAAQLLWPLITPVPIVSTVLGDSRPATRFAANGDYFCPFCTNPVWRSKGENTCQNPGCDAFPMWDLEKLKIHRAHREKLEAEQTERQRTHEWGMQRIRDEQEARRKFRAEKIAEAIQRGTCLNCLFYNYRVKFIKHRGPCPKERA